MLTPELEQLIQYALADGVLTDKERAVLMKKAEAAGADLDEFEMILEAKVHEAKKAAAAAAPKASNKEGEGMPSLWFTRKFIPNNLSRMRS